ncbi:MAG TPA: heavy-metal-associated domain-containing protein [Burkholderiales bacterium]|jgi:copper chaperone|nr:heavy-metal-associated domain-containing protein [Burkholderiales bacterium]
MTKLKVEGMTCGGCVRSVERTLKAVDADAQVGVSLERGEAELKTKKDAAPFIAALERAGYKASVLP